MKFKKTQTWVSKCMCINTYRLCKSCFVFVMFWVQVSYRSQVSVLSDGLGGVFIGLPKEIGLPEYNLKIGRGLFFPHTFQFVG